MLPPTRPVPGRPARAAWPCPARCWRWSPRRRRRRPRPGRDTAPPPEAERSWPAPCPVGSSRTRVPSQALAASARSPPASSPTQHRGTGPGSAGCRPGRCGPARPFQKRGQTAPPRPSHGARPPPHRDGRQHPVGRRVDPGHGVVEAAQAQTDPRPGPCRTPGGRPGRWRPSGWWPGRSGRRCCRAGSARRRRPASPPASPASRRRHAASACRSRGRGGPPGWRPWPPPGRRPLPPPPRPACRQRQAGQHAKSAAAGLAGSGPLSTGRRPVRRARPRTPPRPWPGGSAGGAGGAASSQSPLWVQLGDAALQGHGGPAQALIGHGRPPCSARRMASLAAPVELGLDRPLGQAEGPGDLGHRGVGHMPRAITCACRLGRPTPPATPRRPVRAARPAGLGRPPARPAPWPPAGAAAGPAGPPDRHPAHPGRGVPDPGPVVEGAQERVLGVSSATSRLPKGVGQPHDGVVLADVEASNPRRPGRRGDAAWTSGSPCPPPARSSRS